LNWPIVAAHSASVNRVQRQKPLKATPPKRAHLGIRKGSLSRLNPELGLGWHSFFLIQINMKFIPRLCHLPTVGGLEKIF
jgi:hypothetical protein